MWGMRASQAQRAVARPLLAILSISPLQCSPWSLTCWHQPHALLGAKCFPRPSFHQKRDPVRKPTGARTLLFTHGKDQELQKLIDQVPWKDHLQQELRSMLMETAVRSSIFSQSVDAPIEPVDDPFLRDCGVKMYLKRDDLIHPEISGNKWRKLKYNALRAAMANQTLLTFGGAYSNHIAATAAAGAACHLRTVGIIRGEEFADDAANPTLSFARAHGMQLRHVSRAKFRLLREALEAEEEGEGGAGAGPEEGRRELAELVQDFSPCAVLPEGGSNALGVCGCAETLLMPQDRAVEADVIAVACGTGATLAGLAAGSGAGQRVIGFAALKGGGFLLPRARAMLAQVMEPEEAGARGRRVEVETGVHCGGYARTPPHLIDFLRRFYATTGVRLDPVYTGKMMLGLYGMAQRGELRGRRVLAVHTGGLQGIPPVERRLGAPLYPPA